MNIIEIVRHVPVCQKCYTHGPECSTMEIAFATARARGWLRIDDRTYCPDCRREKEEEKTKKRGGGNV